MSKRARAKRLTLRRDLAERMNQGRLSEDIDKLLNAIRRGLQGQELAQAEAEPHFAEEAKKRQGTRTDLKENVPTSDGKRRPAVQSRDQAAAAVGVSGKLLSAAKAIREGETWAR